jgi:hypothetical protein
MKRSAIGLKAPTLSIATLLIYAATAVEASANVRMEPLPIPLWLSLEAQKPTKKGADICGRRGSISLLGSSATWRERDCSLTLGMDSQSTSKHRRVPVEKKIVLINRRHGRISYRAM